MCFPRVLNSWHVQVIIRWWSIFFWNDVFLIIIIIIMIIRIWSSVLSRLVVIIQRVIWFITTQRFIVIWWNITMLIWMNRIVIIWWHASLSRRIFNSSLDGTSHLILIILQSWWIWNWCMMWIQLWHKTRSRHDHNHQVSKWVRQHPQDVGTKDSHVHRFLWTHCNLQSTFEATPSSWYLEVQESIQRFCGVDSLTLASVLLGNWSIFLKVWIVTE